MTAPIAVEILGTGSFLPELSVSNLDLYGHDAVRRSFDVERARQTLRHVEDARALSDADVFDGWARQVTGIAARRVLTPESGLTTEDMCARAASRALEAAGMAASDLDVIYLASLTCSDEVPNGACTVASKIGAPRLGGFTLNAACAGFVYALASAWAAIKSGLVTTALAASGDTLSRYVDYDDMRTAVVFGDGAGAAVLTAASSDLGILGRPVMYGEFAREPLYMVGQGWEREDEPFPKLHMEGGPSILRNAIITMASAAERALRTADLSWGDVDIVIPHQANLRITRGLEKHIELPKGRVVHNIEGYGNMSASTVAVTLDEVLRGRHGEVPRPATIVLTAIGGGYTTAATALRV